MSWQAKSLELTAESPLEAMVDGLSIRLQFGSDGYRCLTCRRFMGRQEACWELRSMPCGETKRVCMLCVGPWFDQLRDRVNEMATRTQTELDKMAPYYAAKAIGGLSKVALSDLSAKVRLQACQKS